MGEYLDNHKRVHKSRGRARDQACIDCGKQAQEWAHRHDTNPAAPGNYDPRCCSCHQKYDDHWNEETRAKVASSAKEQWAEPGYKRRVGAAISAAKMGHVVTDETRSKISRAKKGVKTGPEGNRSPEQCERIRAGRWGEQ